MHFSAAAPEGAQRHAAERVVQAATDAWRQLEPGNLKAVAATAIAPSVRQRSLAHLPPLRSALQLAQQQRSPYWIVQCASEAVSLLLPVLCHAGTLRAVIQDFSLAEPALQSCRRLLPQPWVTVLSVAHESAAAALPVLRSRLAALESVASPSPYDLDIAADRQLLEQFKAAVDRQSGTVDSFNKCAGCGRHAAGLRACARCRMVYYCSRECQAAAWPQHKRECRPA